jgi:hypothetical protein
MAHFFMLYYSVKTVAKSVCHSWGASLKKVKENNPPGRSRDIDWLLLVIVCMVIVPTRAAADILQANISEQHPPETNSAALAAVGCSMFDTPAVSLRNPTSKPSPVLPVGIMRSRYEDLEQTLAGYSLSKTPLVAFDGKHFVPAGFSDDPGLYFFLPAIGRVLQKSLDQSITIFYLSILGLAYVLGSVGFVLILAGWPNRIVAIVWLLFLTALVYKIGDLYIVEFALPVSLVPWILWWAGRAGKMSLAFNVFLFVVGALIASAEFIRLTSGPPVLAFTVILLMFYVPLNRKSKIMSLSVLLVGFVLPRTYFGYLTSRRDAFIRSHSPGLQMTLHRNVFWHSAYMGLGFLRNSYVQGSCDDFNKEKVRSVNSDAAYLSPEYDAILKAETLAVVRQHPMFVIFTVAAKLGIVISVVLVFANVGFFVARRRQKFWHLQLAFWVAIALSAAPLAVVVPLKLYLVGLMSFSTVYGIIATFPLSTADEYPLRDARQSFALT